MTRIKSYFFVACLALSCCCIMAIHPEEPRAEQEIVAEQKKKVRLNPKAILRGFKVLINMKKANDKK